MAVVELPWSRSHISLGKDSSVILSPSSSGESLISCDLILETKGRVQGEITSDSAISDVSSNKVSSGDPAEPVNSTVTMTVSRPSKLEGKLPVPKPSGIPGTNTLASSVTSKLSKLQSTYRNTRISQGSPSQAKPVEKTPVNKSEGRSALAKPAGTALPKVSVSTINKTPVPGSRLKAPEKKPTFLRQNQNRSSAVQSNGNSTTATATAKRNDTFVIPKAPTTKSSDSRESSDLCKGSSDAESTDMNSVSNSHYFEGVLDEVLLMKGQLEELQKLLLESERREQEKDRLIEKLTEENKSLKTENIDHQRVLSISTSKSKSIRQSMENVAVQTEYNLSKKRSVTYPDENDKAGQLVSFRIGRHRNECSDNE